jgi:hypothetical protein
MEGICSSEKSVDFQAILISYIAYENSKYPVHEFILSNNRLAVTEYSY